MPRLICDFEVIGTPRPAGSKSYMGRSKKGKAIIVDSASKNGGRDWTALVQDRARIAMRGWDGPVDGPLLVEFLFSRTRPKDHLTSKGALSAKGMRTPYPVGAPDTVKLTRRVEDAMKGIVYVDDSRIVRHTLEKSWGARDGVTVRVWALEGRR